MNWKKLETEEKINLKETLFSGQVFNFIDVGENEYVGVMYDFLVSFKSESDDVYYKILKINPKWIKQLENKIMNTHEDNDIKIKIVTILQTLNDNIISCKPEAEEIENVVYNFIHRLTFKYIRRFFTLKVNYKSIIEEKYYYKNSGLRLINNAILPTIFSFICSSNNNIKRITKMVKIIYEQGEFIMNYKDKSFHYFPSLDKLVGKEDFFKKEGFGYRSSYVSASAEKLIQEDKFLDLIETDDVLLHDFIMEENMFEIKSNPVLCENSRDDVSRCENIREKLLKLPGVGPKVVDCILLMGFGFLFVVPIDVHIFRHGLKIFNLEKTKLSKKIYKEVQDLYKERYGEYSGIIQLYIFSNYIRKP